MTSLITRDPNTGEGRWHIAGTGILVRAIKALHEAGRSTQDILIAYPGLTVEQVEAAVAFDQPEVSRVRATDDEIEVGYFELRRHRDVIVTDEWGVDLSPDEARAVAEWIMRAIGEKPEGPRAPCPPAERKLCPPREALGSAARGTCSVLSAERSTQSTMMRGNWPDDRSRIARRATTYDRDVAE